MKQKKAKSRFVSDVTLVVSQDGPFKSLRSAQEEAVRLNSIGKDVSIEISGDWDMADNEQIKLLAGVSIIYSVKP